MSENSQNPQKRSQTSQTWTIVKFIKENTVEAVSSSWINDKLCYWPPSDNYSKEQIQRFVRRHEDHNPDWEIWDIQIFKNGTFGKI